jgi:hypothetical protein
VTAWHDLSDRIDRPHLVRGASTGFTILVIGGFAAPLVGLVPVLGPVLGPPWLIIVAVVAFVVAGSRIGRTPGPRLHGAAAAVTAYVLTLPLVALSGNFQLIQIPLTLLVAIVMGGLSGHLAARRAAGPGNADRGR